MNNHISEICPSSTVASYLAQDDDAVQSEEAIETTSKTWQEDMRNEAILIATDDYENVDR